MRIPHTIPKIILRAYARELTPEQLKLEYEGRPIRSEDTTWDEDISPTYAEQCLNLIVSEYPFYVKLTEEANTEGREKHKKAKEKWEEELKAYNRKRDDYERKLLAFELQGNRGQLLDDDDDDDDDSGIPKVLAPPDPVSETFKDFVPWQPVLDRLSPSDRMVAVEDLDFKQIPLKMAVDTIPDEHYWERAALDRWPWISKDNYGNSWRRAYLEQHAIDAIENFHPFEGKMEELIQTLEMVAPQVKELTLINLIPNCFGVESRPKIFKPFTADEELMGEEDEGFSAIAELRRAQKEAKKEDDEEPLAEGETVVRDNSHMDFSQFMHLLTHLRKLSLVYEMQEMAMEWEPRFTEFTDADVKYLAKALTLAPNIEHFELVRSRMTYKQCRTLIRDAISKMPRLKILNMSYNNIRNKGARAVARILTQGPGRSTLHTVILARNSIKNKGAKALAYALSVNQRLIWLDIRLNRIRDSGGKDFGHALVKNSTLQHLNLAANRLTDETCSVVGKMLNHNNTLKELDISSNNFGRKGGQYLAGGIRNNKTLLKLDVRLCDLGLDFEYDIDAHLRRNRSRLPYSILERDDVVFPTEDEEIIEGDVEEEEGESELESEETEDEEEDE